MPVTSFRLASSGLMWEASDMSKETPGKSTLSKNPLSMAGGPKHQVGNCKTIASAARRRVT